MAIATSNTAPGDGWGNSVDADLIERFLFQQSAKPTLSADTHDLTYNFGQGTSTSSVFFHSTAGFGLDPLSGVINGVDTPGTHITGLAIDTTAFQTAVLDGDVAALSALVWGGNDTITGGTGNDNISGYGGNDVINGGDGNDRLYGDIGADKLYGGNGDDLLLGGADRDQLFGNGGNDELVGGSGNDMLTGGAGLDRMFGGTGADTFIFRAMSDFAPYTKDAPLPFDTVGDFHHSEGDKIDLYLIDADTTMSGNQAFTFIGTDAFTLNHPGTLHIVATASPNAFLVEVNTNNDAKPEGSFLVLTPNGVAPVADDLIL